MGNHSNVSEYYDLEGEIYEADAANAEYQAPQNFVTEIKPFIKNANMVLDIGIGTGLSSLVLVSEGKQVCGLDLSKKLLIYAKRRKPANLILGDLTKPLPFRNSSFDLVASCATLNYYNDIGKPLQEMQRITKADGIIAFTTSKTGLRLQTPKRSIRFFSHNSSYLEEHLDEADLILYTDILAHLLEGKQIYYSVYVFKKWNGKN